MMKKAITATLLSLAMTNVSAQYVGHDTGKVLDVEPIYERVKVSYPQRECWTETTRRQSYSHNNHANTNTVVGGIIGGLLGQNVGKGRGRDAAIVAGSLLGAAVASDHNGYSDRRPHYYEQEERRCETRHRTAYERRKVGYRVHYEYNDRDYWTTTTNHPGRYISINIKLNTHQYVRDYEDDYNRFDSYDDTHEMTDADYYDD